MTMEAPPYESLSKWIDDHAPSGRWISLQNHQMSRMFDHILKIAPFFEGDPASKHENSGPKCYTGGPTADRLLSVKVNRLSERLAPS